jgi:clan AA aspartic protease
MGIVTTKFLLRNPRQPQLAIEVEAVADTGSVHLCIPDHIRAKLQLDVVAEKDVILVDGSLQKVPYVGPIELRFKGRVGFAGALVLGDEVLIGAIPMEDLDLIVVPRTQTLDVNPASPDAGRSIVKQQEAAYSVDSEVAQ